MAKDPKDDTAAPVATEAPAQEPAPATVETVAEEAAPAAPEDAPVPQAAPAPKEFPLSIAEACARISSKDRRIEMIGAFHASEKAAGRLKDFESAYRERYAAFCNAPA